MDEPIRILIVDDSRIFRRELERILGQIRSVEVIGSVWNGTKALECLQRLTSLPDLVTLDLHMPEMDGLATMRAIADFNRQRQALLPIEVLIISSLAQRGGELTIEALQAGAFDFVTKSETDWETIQPELFRKQILCKVRAFAMRRYFSRKNLQPQPQPSHALCQSACSPNTVELNRLDEEPLRLPYVRNDVWHAQGLLNSSCDPCEPADAELAVIPPPVARRRAQRLASAIVQTQRPQGKQFAALVMACSTGGPAALAALLPRLLNQMNLPIFLVQHLPTDLTRYLAENLARLCPNYRVCEASDGEIATTRTLYVAPGGKHLVLRADGSEQVRLVLNQQPPENGCRPSADLLFRSAAKVYQDRCLAIVLTGMGCDGTRGLGTLHRSGGYVLAQDEASSVVWGMPGSAVAAGCVDEVHALHDLPQAIRQLLS